MNSTLSFTEAATGGYAFRLLGDYSGDTSFLALIGMTSINGQRAMFRFDGAYTDVTAAAAVPEPATYAMLLGGLGLIGAVVRRRKQGI